MHNKWELSN